MTLPLGLVLVPNFLDVESERNVVAWIDQQPWNTTLKRRTQHYGYEYNYGGRGRSPLVPTTPISGPLLTLSEYLRDQNVFGNNITSSQCIVNEYMRDQGIASHTDSPVFGPVIVSVSLLAPTVMTFSRGDSRVLVDLPPRSALIMSGEARSEWRHEIPSRVTLTHPDGSTESKPTNYRRISLTYRTTA